MKTLAELTDYYHATMRPRLEGMEAERRRYLPRIWRHARWLLLAWAAAVGGALAMGVAVRELGEALLPAHVGLVFALVGVVIWRLIVYFSHASRIGERCKEQVVVPMLRWVTPELNYEPQGCVALDLVEGSQLVRAHDRLEGEDHFQGRLGQTELEFSELVVHYHTTEKDRDGRTKVTHHEERGLFMVTAAHKPFAGETLILPDDLEGVLGDTAARALTAGRRGSLHLIHLEDPAFEHLFKVYCTDDVEAHYLLTPSLMARLAAYREHHGRDVRLIFQQARLCAYFPPTIGQRAALFDLSALSDLLDFEPVQRIHHELAMVLGLVEELNLNTRIWGTAPPVPA